MEMNRESYGQHHMGIPTREGTTPPAQPTHDFTLQAIMELQKSTGQLTESVGGLKASIEAQTANIDKITDKQDQRITLAEAKLTGIEKKLYAAGVVMIILIAVGGFLVDKLWDKAMSELEQPSIAKSMETTKSSQKN